MRYDILRNTKRKKEKLFNNYLKRKFKFNFTSEINKSRMSEIKINQLGYPRSVT